MNNKYLVILLVIILIVCFGVGMSKLNKKDEVEEVEQQQEVFIEKNNETGLYKVYVGEELVQDDIDESMIKIYEDNPYFDPSF